MEKKISMHKRMLITFIGILFFSFLLTGIIFDFARGNGFISVGIMFAVATIATYILSKSITHPIKKLGKFASEIGSGNFKQNDYEFRETELQELNAVLNDAAKRLAEYDSEQKTFFQNASHELRTPLMSIKCYAEGVATGIMEPRQAAETILQETDRLTALVADLLYISQIDNITVPIVKSKVNLIDIVKESTMRQQAMADRREISFVFDFDNDAQIYYNCSQELVSRAIDNLVSNGIRYACSKIVLSCRKKAGQIYLSVADDGNGVDADVLPRVFERFYKGSGGNTGIGLSIVKSIVEQHGGTIAIENSNGAVFTIVLPTGEV